MMSSGISSVRNFESKNERKKNCLLACTGSVATVKVPELAVRLSQHFDIVIICSANAKFFLQRAKSYNEAAWQQFIDIGGMSLVLDDDDEWGQWQGIGDDIVHIQLRKWADVVVVAPASANLIAKASVGICDNLVLSVLRAWELRKHPSLLCPAMNTVMWDHPSTRPAIAKLQSWGWKIIGPVEKMLACKEVGSGAMASVDSIVLAVCDAVDHFSGENTENKLFTDQNDDYLWHPLNNPRNDFSDKFIFTFRLATVPAMLLIWGLLQQNHRKN